MVQVRGSRVQAALESDDLTEPDRHRHPRAAKSAFRAAIPGSTARDVGDVHARAGDRRARARRRAAASLGSRVLQRSIADRAADADPRRRAGRSTALVAARIEQAIAFRESLAIDATAYRLVHGEARSAAVADRRSLRRLPRRAGAVAGHGPAAAAVIVRCCWTTAAARGHPGAQRSARRGCSRGSSSTSSAGTARCPTVVTVPRTAGRLRRRSAARPEDRAVPRSAREPRGRGAVRARPAARLLQLHRRLCAAARAACRRD